MKPLALIESPFAARAPGSQENLDLHNNIAYARRAVRDSLLRGEAPIASHLLYTQAGVLDDNEPGERKLGIEAGLEWLRVASLSAVYVDRGISPGMILGIRAAQANMVPVHLRSLEDRFHETRICFPDELLTPGAPLAASLGCRCAQIDNHFGEWPRFAAVDCYLHGGRDYVPTDAQ